jgi:hypothetical protein
MLETSATLYLVVKLQQTLEAWVICKMLLFSYFIMIHMFDANLISNVTIIVLCITNFNIIISIFHPIFLPNKLKSYLPPPLHCVTFIMPYNSSRFPPLHLHSLPYQNHPLQSHHS